MKIKNIINEIKGINIENPVSNLYIKGWGLDTNGNMRIIVGFPNDKGFSIQTNGKLKRTHNIISGKSDKSFDDAELETIGNEVTEYVSKYGSSNVKSRLRIYNK